MNTMGATLFVATDGQRHLGFCRCGARQLLPDAEVAAAWLVVHSGDEHGPVAAADCSIPHAAADAVTPRPRPLRRAGVILRGDPVGEAANAMRLLVEVISDGISVLNRRGVTVPAELVDERARNITAALIAEFQFTPRGGIT